MQNAELFDNMPATLAEKVQAYADYTEKKARSICKRNHVPQDVCDVFILDAVDMLRAQYRGLRATTEQMRLLTACVPHRSWGRTENAALCFTAKYYADIVEHVDGTPIMGYGFGDAVVLCELLKRQPAAVGAVAVDDDDTDTDDDDTDDGINNDAQRFYYMCAILIAAEHCDATEAELNGMQPYGGNTMTDEQRSRAVAMGLNFMQQRKQMQAARAQRTTRRGAADDTADMFSPERGTKKQPATYANNKTIMQYQNFAYMAGNGTQTADNLPDGRSGTMRPIWQGIEEQRRLSLAVINDATASDEDKRRAAELVADTYAVAQVIDGMQLLPQYMKPISGNTEYSGYITTPREFYRIATGIENPNSEQLLHFLRAIAWVDTQRLSVAENSEKLVTERDSSGVVIRDEYGKPKRKKVQRTIVTNFRPLNVTFRTEYEDSVPLQNATQLFLNLHNIVKDGRSGKYIEQDGKRLYLTAPRQNFMQVEQYYQFTTEEERIFRAIILSKPKQAEDTLLAAVFNYPKRQAEVDRRAAEARAKADELEHDATATAEQKSQAAAEAAAAEKQARYYITNHMGADVERLAGMFEKARKCGLITYFCRRSASGVTYKQNKYGRGFVWEWERSDNGNKQKRAPGRRRSK